MSAIWGGQSTAKVKRGAAHGIVAVCGSHIIMSRQKNPGIALKGS